MRNQAGVLEHVTVTVGIGGTVRGLPGTSAVGSGVPLAIYGRHTTLKQLVDIVLSQNIDPERYLVALRAGADPLAAKQRQRGRPARGLRRAEDRRGRAPSLPRPGPLV